MNITAVTAVADAPMRARRDRTMLEYVGKCGLCGGAVTVPRPWWGVVPPEARCERCGALAEAITRLPMRLSTPGRVSIGATVAAHACEPGRFRNGTRLVMLRI